MSSDDQTFSTELKPERRRTARFSRLFRRPELGALGGTILVLAVFGVWAGDSGLFSVPGIVNFLQVSSELGILTVAVSTLMIGGEFDLSVGSMIGFAGIVIGLGVTKLGLPIWTAALLAFGVAILVGCANGYLSVRSGLPSFIVTLAAMFILRGLTLAVTRAVTGRTQIPYITEGSTEWLTIGLFGGTVGRDLFTWFGHIGLLATRSDGVPIVEGLPVSVLWWIGLTAAATWILARTRFGNWIFASGGDPVAARSMGVPVDAVKVWLFVGTACAATLFSTIQVLNSGSADTLRGLGKDFEAIIAAVIGGNLLTGGYGSAIGPAFGALIFGVVGMGIFYTGIDTDWFQVFLGLMVLISVVFNNYVRRKATEAR